MAGTDPRTTIKTIIDDYLATNPLKCDDGVTNCSVGSLWEGGPEALKYLFFTVDLSLIHI